MDQKILVVDDDMQLTAFLSRFLDKHGFKVQVATSGAQARAMFDPHLVDLLVLDLNLPDADGFDILKDIRRTAKTPVIMLTARDEVFDRIVGLELGADDYLTKPYEPRELLARIKAVMRRMEPAIQGSSAADHSHARFSGLHLDLAKRTLEREDSNRPISLTGAEFALLSALVGRAGRLLSRDEIMDTLYGKSVTITDRAVDAHISRLRRKIDPTGADVSLIQSIRGEGYILAAEVELS
ncbi:response regulator [Epibacterium sp. SM1979]|uniref:Response regulator n=1 Tax=Tritonibacter litoralis TaxID=2662264 RepID=A0A843YB72_9RHOB|nr:response regulator transcription factor [Tritonibacter litoralis]MQQ07128.1 response regulator [Tritonibacter litoralis]